MVAIQAMREFDGLEITGLKKVLKEFDSLINNRVLTAGVTESTENLSSVIKRVEESISKSNINQENVNILIDTTSLITKIKIKLMAQDLDSNQIDKTLAASLASLENLSDLAKRSCLQKMYESL